MSYLSWHVGMKVVCVKTGCWEQIGGPSYVGNMPEHRKIYTIAEIIADEDDVFLRLSEFPHRVIFRIFHFRPVQPRKSDVSVFNRILRNPKIRIKEGA